MKRLLAILLASAMAFHLMPLQAIALSGRFSSSVPAEMAENPEELGQGSLEKCFWNSVEEENSADFSAGNRITNITMNGRTAIVTYAAETDAELVVGIYADDTEEELIASGTVGAAKTTDGTAKIEIVGTIPENYVIKGYLFAKEEHVPLCEPFKSSFYTQEIADIKNATVKEFPEDRVLNLDEDDKTNFAVVKQGVTLVKAENGMNKVTQQDEESLTYTIANAGEEIRNLRVGDVLVLDELNENPLILRVNSLSVSGGAVTLIGDDTLRLEDVFSALKIEKAGSSQSVEELSRETAKGSTTLKTDYSVAVYISENEREISLSMENQVEGNAELSEKGEESVSFGPVSEILARGISLNIEPVVKVRAEGKANAKFSLKTEDGVRWDGNFHNTGKDPAAELESPADTSVTVTAELAPVLEIFDGMTEMTLKNQTGIRAESTKKGGEELEDGVKHVCKECYSVTKTETSRVEAEIRRSKGEKAQKATLSKIEKTLGKTYDSPEYGESGDGDCPHWSYRVRLTLDGVKTEGVAVFQKDSEDALIFVGATDESGIAEVYLVPGEYAFTAKTGGKEYSGACEIIDYPMEIVLKPQEEEEPEPPEEIVEAFGNCGENLRWIVDKNGTLTIDGSGEMFDYDADPARKNLPPWSEEELQKRFGMENVSITKIVLKNGITRIGDAAFAGMKITEVNIPETVTSFGAFSFKNCESLKKVEFPATLTEIGRDAFADCTALEEVVYEGNKKGWSAIDIRPGNERLTNAKITYQTADEPEDEIKDNKTEDKPGEDDKEDEKGDESKEDKSEEGNRDEDKEDTPDEGGKDDIPDDTPKEDEKEDDKEEPGADDKDEVKEDQPGEGDKPGESDKDEEEDEPKEDDKNEEIPGGEGDKEDGKEDKPSEGDKDGEIEDKPNTDDKEDDKGDEDDKKDDEPEKPAESPNTGKCGENLTWELSENGVLTIRGSGRMDDYEETKTPWNVQNVKDVVIENGVTSIGRNAFRGCEGVKEIQLPESVETIGDSAFAFCTQLKKLWLPQNLTKIGRAAFSGCESLTSINLSGNLTEIEAETFSNCTALKQVIFPEEITRIGEKAFYGCQNLADVTLAETVEVLEKGTFAESGLKTIIIPASMRRIEENVFSGCALELVFYTGTKSGWRATEIVENGNEVLHSVTIHCINGDILPVIENSITAGTAGKNDTGDRFHAVFNGLIAGESYAVIVSRLSENPLDAANLIYVNQKKADANGVLDVLFISDESNAAYVVACGREPEKIKYTVTIKVGDAVVKTIEAAEGETVTIEVPEKLDDGREFQKWNVDAGTIELQDASSAKTSFTMAAEDVVLHAVYKTSGNSPDDSGTTKPGDASSGSSSSSSGGDTSSSGNSGNSSSSGTTKPDKPGSGSSSGSGSSGSSGSSSSSSSGSASSGSSSSSSSGSSSSSSSSSSSNNNDNGGAIVAVVLIGGAAIAAVTAGVILMMPVEVSGVAQLDDGTVLANVTVQLMKDGKLAAQTMTDESGHFALEVKRGKYTLNMITTHPETGEQIVRTASIKAPMKNTSFVF